MSAFLTEFKKLLLEKPRYHLKIVNSENCDYADTAVNSKDGYYSFGLFHGDQVYYSRYSRNCSNSSDLTFCFDLEWSYACVGCSKSYGLHYSNYCSNSSNLWFSEDCHGSKNLFGCIGLQQKEYYFFNEPLSKEDYERRLSEIDLSNPLHRQTVMSRLQALRQTVPQLATHQTMCEDSVGDNLVQCKNAYQCFDGYDLEDCGYAIETNRLKNCYDMTVCFKTEESYQCVHCPGNYGLKFSIHCDGCSESEFCAYSKNLKNCFGCVYLQDKQFYILNQPYSEADYYAKVTEIKQELIDAGQYNLLPFFVSDYETKRMQTETDPVIAS